MEDLDGDAVAGAVVADGPQWAPDETSSLTAHAREELARFGEDPGLAASIVATVAAFTSFGHSGGSAPHAVALLEVLLRRGTLTELTADPGEWIDRSEQSGYPMWQSARCPAAFSSDGGKTFWLLPNRDGMTGRPKVSRDRLVGVRNGRRFWRSVEVAA